MQTEARTGARPSGRHGQFALFLSPRIEDLQLVIQYLTVQGHRVGVEVGLRVLLGVEVLVGVLSANQQCTAFLVAHLFDVAVCMRSAAQQGGKP